MSPLQRWTGESTVKMCSHCKQYHIIVKDKARAHVHESELANLPSGESEGFGLSDLGKAEETLLCCSFFASLPFTATLLLLAGTLELLSLLL